MQNEPIRTVDRMSSDNIGDVDHTSSSLNQIENPEKALLELFRESTESRQAFIIQIYFYGGITVVALCAAIFLMMYLT
ncbi:MAG: hypothetical protein LW714_05110 [Oxalobacteraceae bacterium]|jgi:hypothetical protein|nr:hypothetical protein [Oxalobacteraceae bacterium]